MNLLKYLLFHKHNLILVSRNIKKLTELAKELTDKYNIRVDIIEQDLSEHGAAKAVFDTVDKMRLNVDILVNNAGVGGVGYFYKIEREKDYEMIQLNTITLTEMTKLFSRQMIKREKGKILNVASTGAFSPGPFIAVYYATKAYVLSLSEALYKELKPYNISVTTLCPGATKTNFAKIAGKKDTPGAMDARVVAKRAYNGLIKNKRVVIPGLANKILTKFPRRLISTVNFKNQKRLALDEEYLWIK